MTRSIMYALMCAVLFIVTISCSGSHEPLTSPSLTTTTSNYNPHKISSSTNLWGFYDVYVNLETAQVEVVTNRGVMFTCNVTNFLNQKASNLSFQINEIVNGADYIDVDIDVGITHPFPGMPQYNGYDVRGIFMGDGSAALSTGGGVYPLKGTDQTMLADPDDGIGGPDGYTRWFNQAEFSTGGMPLFQYLDGALASKGYNKTATLNAYKYFADSLGANDSLWDWLNTNPTKHGQFSSGMKNIRNYYLRFPLTKGIKYGYAVIANWQGVSQADHPSNTLESISCKIDDSSTVYYENPSSKGGNLIFDISLWNWKELPLDIFVESTVLSSPYQLNASEIIPIGGNENFSTWHVEIPADNINGTSGNEYWIIAQYDSDYSNDFGVGNLIENEPLAVYFRFDLNVSNSAPGDIIVTSPNGGESLNPADNFDITWISSSSEKVDIAYSKDNFVSDINLIVSNDTNDGTFSWDVPCDVTGTAKVRVSFSTNPSIFDTSDNVFSINGDGWAQTWGDSPGFTYCGGSGMAIDKDGNIFSCGKYNGLVDFNPGGTVENHDTLGGYDIYVSKYSNCGEYLWTRTFGGTNWENSRACAVDSEGSVYVTGDFTGPLDFDPDPVGTAVENGTSDAFLVKFDSNGSFKWVRTWGAGSSDFTYDVVCDGGYVYTTGWFAGAVNFNDTGGSDVKTAAGIRDSFLTKYDTSGNYVWTRTWGGSGFEWGTGVDVDSSGNIYCTGWFENTVDFDPGGGYDPKTADANPGMYLTKFDSSGNYVWARTWGGSNTNNWDFSPDVGVRNSDVIVAHRFVGTVDFDPGTGYVPRTSNGDQDCAVSKFDTSGNFKWVNTWGGTNYETARGAAIDDNGYVYVSAEFNGTVDLDPDPGSTLMISSNGILDLSLHKFDPDGKLVWVRTWGGFAADRPGLVALDQMNNVFMSGYFRGTNVEFAPTGAPCGNPSYKRSMDGETDAFIVKYHSDGCWK